MLPKRVKQTFNKFSSKYGVDHQLAESSGEEEEKVSEKEASKMKDS